MRLAQRLAQGRVDHHAAVHPADELLEVVEAVGVGLFEHFVEGDQIGVEHQADVGQVILVVGGDLVVAGAVQFAVMALERGAVELFAQHRVHRAEDAGEPRPVDHLVVAPFGAQRGLVDVDDHRGALVEVEALLAQERHPVGQQPPAVGGVDAGFIHRIRRLLLGAVCADEAGAAQTAERDDVAIGLAVVEERVAEEEHFGQGLAGAAQFLDLVEKPGGCFGVVRVLLARNLIGAEFHVEVRVAQPWHSPIHRFQVAVDDHVPGKIRQAPPAKLCKIGNFWGAG